MPRTFFYLLRTLVIGTMGGLIGYVFNFPLGWLVGAMLATIPFAMAGVKMPISWGLRSVMIGVIGLMAGGTFTPELLSRAGEWVFSLTGVAVYCAIVTVIGLFVCTWLGKQDRATAAFSSVPGGLSEVLSIGPSYGADVRSLSLVHGMRLVVILIIVPVVVVWIGNGGTGPVTIDRSIDFSVRMPILDFVILAACLVIGIYGGRKIRLPAAHLTGPLILSAIVHYTGLTEVHPPQLVLIAAQIVIGTSVAQFFSDTSWRHILQGLVVGGGLTIINLLVAVVFALGFEAWLDIPFATGLMALVPGGLPEMSLVSLALGLDAAFVSLHHLFRVVLVLFLLPVLVPLWAGKPQKAH